MKLYEVVFYGSHGNGNAEDTIYLVRAPDFRAAADEVSTNASPSDHGGEKFPLAHVVFEIGSDASLGCTPRQQILRGPYFHHAYNCGWRGWHRKIEGSNYTRDWEEENGVS